MVNYTQKMVSFDKVVSVHVVPNQRQLEHQEKHELWFSKDDLTTMKKGCRKEVNDLDQAEEFDIFSFRGLEIIARDARTAKKIKATVSAVVAKYNDQKDEGSSSSRVVRNVYESLSKSSVEAARENALIDKLAVKKYLSTTEEEVQQGIDDQQQRLKQQQQDQQQQQQKRRRSKETEDDLKVRKETKSGHNAGISMIRRMTVRQVLKSRRPTPSCTATSFDQ